MLGEIEAIVILGTEFSEHACWDNHTSEQEHKVHLRRPALDSANKLGALTIENWIAENVRGKWSAMTQPSVAEGVIFSFEDLTEATHFRLRF